MKIYRTIQVLNLNSHSFTIFRVNVMDKINKFF